MISSNQLHLLKLLTTQSDWKFPLIRIINNTKCFLDVVKVCLILNFILKYIPFIYISPFHINLVQQPRYNFSLFSYILLLSIIDMRNTLSYCTQHRATPCILPHFCIFCILGILMFFLSAKLFILKRHNFLLNQLRHIHLVTEITLPQTYSNYFTLQIFCG